METLRLKGRIGIRSQFYPIGYGIRWHYFKQRQGQSVQEYTTEFKKMAIMLGISTKNPDVLLKYLGGLHNHLQKQVMLFNPMAIGEACVQA
jgi:hypothetical protein